MCSISLIDANDSRISRLPVYRLYEDRKRVSDERRGSQASDDDSEPAVLWTAEIFSAEDRLMKWPRAVCHDNRPLRLPTGTQKKQLEPFAFPGPSGARVPNNRPPSWEGCVFEVTCQALASGFQVP